MTDQINGVLNDQAESWLRQGAAVCKVKVYGKSCENTANGEVFIRVLSQKDRFLRALRIFALGWGLGVLSIVIPLLHFLLVPAFFVGTVAIAWHYYQQETIRLGGASTCPRCGNLFQIIGGRARWPFTDVCAACQEPVEIQKFETLR